MLRCLVGLPCYGGAALPAGLFVFPRLLTYHFPKHFFLEIAENP